MSADEDFRGERVTTSGRDGRQRKVVAGGERPVPSTLTGLKYGSAPTGGIPDTDAKGPAGTGDLPDGPSVPEQVLVYLYTNRDRAFSRSEITTGIEEDPNTVGTALSRLKQRNLVRHSGEYWARTEDLERIQNAWDLHTVTERLRDEDGGIEPDEWDAVAPDEPYPSEQN